MWLSGEGLPYYYWGALMWTVPISVSGISLDFAYNLVVGLAGGCLWRRCCGRLAVEIGGTHRSGLLVAFFGLFAGTPDAVRQLFAGQSLAGISISGTSSRQIVDTITEFPLFTFWHGDLHPHLLSMPVACLALSGGARGGEERSAVAGHGRARRSLRRVLGGQSLVDAADAGEHCPAPVGRRSAVVLAGG